MVGDASNDMDAAQTSGIPFLLRKTNENIYLQGKNINCIDNFCIEETGL